MLINAEQFANCARTIADLKGGIVAVDFETDGLSAYKGAKAFIMGFTDHEGNRFCVRDMRHDAMRLFFSNPVLKYASHNSKFESAFLFNQFMVTIRGTIWDTEVCARLERNNHLSYSLQNCAERIGFSKHKPMLEWLKLKGNKAAYHRAPASLIEPYVEQDAWLSWELANRQIEIFRHWDKGLMPIREVVSLELQTTPHLFDMEAFGLLVDVNYCKRALEYETGQIELAKREFKQLTAVPFVDSRKTLKPIFDSHGIRYGTTDLGNASFTEECLAGAGDHPIVAAILRYRNAKKRASSYWENFLELEHNGIIHPSINQNRAVTGRMSISDPSCQNWSRDDNDPEFPIRRAFIAYPDCHIVSLDYKGMELVLAADEAGDTKMIDAIKSGADLHQRTADRAGVPRSLAKNGRFARGYGAGPKKVAETLGIPIAQAKVICDAIDAESPQVAEYSNGLMEYAKRNPFGYNWLGRRFYFDRGFEYKAMNYRIQGGCSEILRIAICNVGQFLAKARKHHNTAMIIPIHDELCLSVHESDLDLIPEVKRLMIAAHRNKKHLDMDVSVGIGPNFHDLEDWKI